MQLLLIQTELRSESQSLKAAVHFCLDRAGLSDKAVQGMAASSSLPSCGSRHVCLLADSHTIMTSQQRNMSFSDFGHLAAEATTQCA